MGGLSWSLNTVSDFVIDYSSWRRLFCNICTEVEYYGVGACTATTVPDGIFISVGGGIGKYCGIDGDVLSALFERAKTDSDHVGAASGQCRRAHPSMNGGRGIYKHSDGDVPIAMHSAVLEDQVANNHTEASVGAAGSAAEVEQKASLTRPAHGCAKDESKLHVLSWNAAGMSEDALSNILVLLAARESEWDVVLIQEGPKCEEEEVSELEDGHLWFSLSYSWTTAPPPIGYLTC